MPKIVVYLQNELIEEYPLGESEIIIGRHEKCDLVLKKGHISKDSVEAMTVSRKHAKIENVDGKYLITDLNSSNGTYINRERISTKELKNGDEIIIGPYILLYKDTEESKVEKAPTVPKEVEVTYPKVSEIDIDNREKTQIVRIDEIWGREDESSRPIEVNVDPILIKPIFDDSQLAEDLRSIIEYFKAGKAKFELSKLESDVKSPLKILGGLNTKKVTLIFIAIIILLILTFIIPDSISKELVTALIIGILIGFFLSTIADIKVK